VRTDEAHTYSADQWLGLHSVCEEVVQKSHPTQVTILKCVIQRLCACPVLGQGHCHLVPEHLIPEGAYPLAIPCGPSALPLVTSCSDFCLRLAQVHA
jgi:hypothetical protein